jgi:hypothetical protein
MSAACLFILCCFNALLLFDDDELGAQKVTVDCCPFASRFLLLLIMACPLTLSWDVDPTVVRL